MGKKISIFTIIITILIVIVGCSTQNKPETIVSEFIEGMKKFDAEAMALKVNPKDVSGKEQVSSLVEDEDDPFQKYFLDYIKSNAKKIKYEIKEVNIDGDRALVGVNFTYVDGGPLFKTTFSEYIKEAFSMAFSGNELTDEENSHIFITIMEEQSKLIEEGYTEKLIKVKCIKLEDKWYIDDPSNELIDVAMSNILSVGQEMDDVFNSDESYDEPITIMEQAELDDMILIEKGIGDEITLASIKLKVTGVEETEILTASYGSPISARDDTKFILVSLDITNITKSGFSMPPDLLLIDNQEREFSTYSNSIGSVDDYMDYRDLSPSIKETGRFIYELPKDSISYYLIIGKAGTNELYKIILK